MDTRSLAQRMVDAANAVNTTRETEERRRAGLPDPQSACRPLPSYWVTEPASAHLPAIQRWSHPFGDRADPLRQLTQLADAERGHYPLGRNGFWHPGVHFDAGTAGTLDQSQVHCLADGEVVAYRIDTQSPRTSYLLDDEHVERPFSRNFVLVRHRLQAPEISGLDATPPSLTFYSLYMHLENWTAYREEQPLKRPAFWPESNTRRVKNTENDFVPGLEGQVWLRCRIGPKGGAVISGLARGTDITVSGTGSYRKLENIPGPRQLLQDGALRGYVDFSFLKPLPNGAYRITTWRDDSTLNVRPSASVEGEPLMTLPNGTEVAISGTGSYRKLEWVNQYVHFDSLLGEREPQVLDDICVLEVPVPIRAGELIGHLGSYQDHDDALPRQQLHLEMFSSESLQTFIDISRAWAQHLPASARTWLKLPQGTPVVPHQMHFSTTVPPRASADTPTSAADLHVPKYMLEGLGADRRIRISTRDGQGGCTWYRLDDLLHGSEGQLLAGWVQVEDDRAQWHSPWDWSGYAAILNGDSLESCQAYALNVQGILPSERDRARAARLADLSDQGPIRSRLFDLVDRERHEVMTAKELQRALHLPAQAQSIARLAIYSESEWYWRPGKWDALDDLFGHSSSSPHSNWLAEKQRIEQLCWWNEVAPKLGLPADGKVWHLHPVGVMGNFSISHLAITVDQLERIFPNASEYNIQAVLNEINGRLDEFKLDTRMRQIHFFAQIRGEVGVSMVGRTESWEYAPDTLKSFSRYYRNKPVEAEQDGYQKDERGRIIRRADQRSIGRKHFQQLNGNRASHPDDGYNFRGRGLIQITGYEKYYGYMRGHNKYWPEETPDTVNNPDLINSMPDAIRSAIWFWISRRPYLQDKGRGLADVKHVTHVVNGGDTGLSEREAAYKEIEEILQ